MSLDAKKGEKKQRPIPPIGAHPAICYAIIDCGGHMKSYKGNPPEKKNILRICWEFPNLPKVVFDETKGPQPLAISQDYVVSLGEKSSLYKCLFAWRGQAPISLAQELPVFLGQPCLINIVHNKDKNDPNITYANIAGNGTGIMRMPQGMQLNALSNTKVFFDLDNYSHEQFSKIPAWIQKTIKESLDWSGIVAKYGNPPEQQTQQNTQFQQPQQNTGFQQQTTQPVQNNASFGGENLSNMGNPFDNTNPPF